MRNPDIFIGPATARPLMAACGYHVVFVAPDGTVWAWGANAPNGAKEPRLPADPRPWKLSDERGWQAIATGYFFTAGIKTNGTLWLWGTLLPSSGIQPRTLTAPRQVDDATNWVSIAAGTQCLFALKSDCTLWTWGYNIENQMGAITNSPVPVRLDEATNWVKLASAPPHSLGLRRDGTLWVWGSDPLAGPGGRPAQVGTETNWVDIACAEYIGLAKQADGRCWVWGDTRSAIARFALPSAPAGVLTRIPTPLTWTNSAGGFAHLLLLTKDGRLGAWGSNCEGALGLGISTGTSKPTAAMSGSVGGRSDWLAITSTGTSSYGLTADGQVWVWGIRLDRTRRESSLLVAARTLVSAITRRGPRPTARTITSSTPTPEPLFRFVCATNGAAGVQHN